MPPEERPALPPTRSDALINALLDRLREVNAYYLDWVVYWYNDEPHDGEFAIYDEALRAIELPGVSELSSMIGGVTWLLMRPFFSMPSRGYGHYRLDVIERTVTQLGEARYEVVVTPLPRDAQEQMILVLPLPNQERLGQALGLDYHIITSDPVDQDRLNRFFAVLEKQSVARVEWVVYWHEDEPHLDDDTLFDLTGESLSPTIDTRLHNYWGSREGQVRKALEWEDAPDFHPVFWCASYAFPNPCGHFQITVPDRQVRKMGEARFAVRKDPWPDGKRPSIRV